MIYTNVTTKVIHWTYGKGPAYPVKLRVTHQGKYKDYGSRYGLRMRLTEEEFAALSGARRGVNKERQEFLKSYELAVQKLIAKIGHFEFEFDKLSELMLGPKKPKKVLLVDALEDYAGQATTPATKEHYEWTAKLIKEYRPKLVVSSVTIEVLRDLEDHMSTKGNSSSTIRSHMKKIRAVMNKAAGEGLINEDRIPFGRHKYVAPGAEWSKKRSSLEDIKRLIEFESKKKLLQLARDIYVFCLFCGGANPVDVFSLEKRNFSDGVIRFDRMKSHVPVEVPTIPLMEEIIERQRFRNRLFPIVKKNLRNDCKTARRVNNDRLKRIVGHAGISLSHARNSFASYALLSGMEKDMIGSMMGHKNTTVTEGYMSFPVESKREKLIILKKYFMQ